MRKAEGGREEEARSSGRTNWSFAFGENRRITNLPEVLNGGRRAYMRFHRLQRVMDLWSDGPDEVEHEQECGVQGPFGMI